MTNPFMDQERVDFIRAKVAASNKKALLTAWPRDERELPLIEVEVDWVKFSTLNHRTKAEQRREMAARSREDLFTSDPLGEEAQEAQYRILAGQAGFNELKEDLAERRQQENAVITADGILINGNRRVAALRSLLHENKDLNARYVRCLVLPADSTPSEIVQLETELQVARDFKQEYSWVNQALLIEELYEKYGRDFDQVAALMHRRPKEIREDYEKIQQVNQLVALSRGRWLHVDFEPNESAFDELANHIRNKNDEEKEAVRTVYFLGTLGGVNYRDLRQLRRADADDLVAAELEGDEQLQGIVELAQAATREDGETDDLLAEVLGEEQTGSLARTVLEYVAGLDRDDQVSLPSGAFVEVDDIYRLVCRAVEKAAEEAEEQRRDVDAARAPIARLERARKELERARDALGRARAVPGWNEPLFTEKLSIIDEVVGDLKKEP